MGKKSQGKDILVKLTQDLKQIYEGVFDEETIKKDLEMMGLKIKPLAGDLNLIDFQNKKFQETLWRLAKLDEFFSTKVKRLSKRDQQILFNIGIEIKQKLESRLKIIKYTQTNTDLPEYVEIEIFRENKKVKN